MHKKGTLAHTARVPFFVTILTVVPSLLCNKKRKERNNRIEKREYFKYSS